MSDIHLPRVSCLCIAGKSHYNASVLLPVAVQCFVEQTYPNRELVIVCDGNREAAEEAAHRFQPERLRFVCTAQATLGALRNISIDNARGELLCQWDSDDAFHPDYVETMVRGHLQTGLPVFLKSQLVYDLERDVAAVRRFPNTFIHGGNLIPRGSWRYPEIPASEDTEILKNFPQVALIDVPELYLRMFTGDNTWDRLHVMREASSLPPHSWDIPEDAKDWVREIVGRYRQGAQPNARSLPIDR